MTTADKTLEQIIAETKKMSKAEQEILLKEIRIRKMVAENKPIVRAKRVKALSLEEINEIKHLSRVKNA